MSSELGRFVQRDLSADFLARAPATPEALMGYADGFSAYAYADGLPTSALDPSGQNRIRDPKDLGAILELNRNNKPLKRLDPHEGLRPLGNIPPEMVPDGITPDEKCFNDCWKRNFDRIRDCVKRHCGDCEKGLRKDRNARRKTVWTSQFRSVVSAQ